ncbi:peptidase T [Solirubrobacter sp. CPCC 204708]|uniref:Peptidase T n=1 Tax=Solirubrobacter deserti TaxID=2282478 RepID=A0ABT4REK0_9ACTN|nr:peptidase T [Solirubrobacter deserti]MBE2318511.1 peptidase T [Solirubrobacter deserti]MDA0136969.1 peptidase T [Solirubrobacter deserti]
MTFTSPLAEALAPGLLERFLRYVRIDTQSARERTRSPSTPGQLDLARLLVDELQAIGLDDAALDGNGYVTATLAGTGPVIGLIAHVDTSPDAPGAGVEPLVHRDHPGGPIELPRHGIVVEASAGDIVTSSGDTLLGADDKAGVAETMAAVAHLAAHPELPRPTLRICFTPDEEIGEGATLFDVERFGAVCAYTLDGSDLGELQDETFSAEEVVLTIDGVDAHPGWAKDVLVNATRIAAEVVAALPPELTPERTDGRDGFIHVYELAGGSGRMEVRAIVRDFDDDQLHAHTARLRSTAEEIVARHPGARLDVAVTAQYPNMRRYIDAFPQAVTAAEEAIRAEGIQLIRTPIRGGTDGSRLSAMGLPTPNLFTGGHDYHSPREWASLQEMAAAAAVVVRLAEVWARDGAPPPR